MVAGQAAADLAFRANSTSSTPFSLWLSGPEVEMRVAHGTGLLGHQVRSCDCYINVLEHAQTLTIELLRSGTLLQKLLLGRWWRRHTET